MKLQKAIWPQNTYAVVEDENRPVTNAFELTDSICEDVEPLVAPTLDFSGQGDPAPIESNDEDGPLVAPVMNFGKPENEHKTASNTDNEPLTIPTMI